MTGWTATEWSAFGGVLSGAGTVIGAVAVIVAAKLGSSTFKSWREQKLSERRIEQAERILTATYKVRRGLSYIRNIAMWGHELAAAEEKLKADDQWPPGQDDQRRLTTQQAYYNRLNFTRDDRVALEECQPMARALFGEQLELAIETLNRQAHTVRVYVDSAARAREHTTPEHREKIDGAIFEGWPKGEDGPNEMDQTIAAQVKLIEDTLVPVLRLEK